MPLLESDWPKENDLIASHKLVFLTSAMIGFYYDDMML